MNKQTLVAVIAVAVLLAVFFIWGPAGPNKANGPEAPLADLPSLDGTLGEPMMENTGAMMPATSDGATSGENQMMKTENMMGGNAAGVAKEFTVVGSNYKFSLAEIKVKKGDLVKINFRSESGFHDFKIDEFGARTKQLQAGGTETISFVADKTGTFEYYCSVGSHRATGMVGKLIVE